MYDVMIEKCQLMLNLEIQCGFWLVDPHHPIPLKDHYELANSSAFQNVCMFGLLFFIFIFYSFLFCRTLVGWSTSYEVSSSLSHYMPMLNQKSLAIVDVSPGCISSSLVISIVDASNGSLSSLAPFILSMNVGRHLICLS